MHNVIVNGTFDILHPGHIRLLKTAKDLGGSLIVAIDSDARVSKLKGPPRMNAQARKTMLESIRYVDIVRIFSSDEDLLKIIDEASVHYMVKGSDYIDKPIIGSDLVRQLVFIPRDEWASSKL